MSLLQQLRDEITENIDSRSFADRMADEDEWNRIILVDNNHYTIQKRKAYIGGKCFGVTYKTLDGVEVYFGKGGYSFDYGKANGL